MSEGFVIAGLGTALPKHSMSQGDAAAVAQHLCGADSQQNRALSVLYRNTGVKTRYSVLLETSTSGAPVQQSFFRPATSKCDLGPPTSARMARYEIEAAVLAARASAAALKYAGLQPNSVTHLVTVSCSGFSAPGVDLALIQRLGLSPETARTHVGFMGCHGALNGLRVAQGFAGADPRAVVLMCAVEVCSLHHQYRWDANSMVASALFADGAAAVVGHAGAVASPAAWRLAASGSVVIPDTEDLMSWRIGDHGFEMTLSPSVPDVIRQHVRPWLDAWLARHELTVAAVGSWAIHPGGPRILAAAAEAIGLEASHLAAAHEVLAECGNISSPSVLFILDKLRTRQAPLPCVALAFGPGLAVEAALFR